MKSPTTPLRVERNGAVETLIINDAPRNRMGLDFMDALEIEVERIASDATVRAVVIRGAGEEHFSVGMDLKQLPEGIERMGSAEAVFDQRLRVLEAIENLSKPVIALLYGYCLGGGLELPLACHFRLAASEGAKIGLPELDLGSVPAWGGSARLARCVGRDHALDMILRAKKISGADALQIGLVSEVWPIDELFDRGEALGQELAAMPAVAVAGMLRSIVGAGEGPLADGIAAERRAVLATLGTPDQREGMMAFLEKRKPVFQPGILMDFPEGSHVEGSNVFALRVPPRRGRIRAGCPTSPWDVADIEVSLAFYRDVFGHQRILDLELAGAEFEAVTGTPGARSRMVRGLVAGNSVVQLFWHSWREPLAEKRTLISFESVRCRGRIRAPLGTRRSVPERARGVRQLVSLRHSGSRRRGRARSAPGAGRGVEAPSRFEDIGLLCHLRDPEGFPIELLDQRVWPPESGTDTRHPGAPPDVAGPRHSPGARPAGESRVLYRGARRVRARSDPGRALRLHVVVPRERRGVAAERAWRRTGAPQLALAALVHVSRAPAPQRRSALRVPLRLRSCTRLRGAWLQRGWARRLRAAPDRRSGRPTRSASRAARRPDSHPDAGLVASQGSEYP